MVKQISYFSLRPVTVGSAPSSLHAAGNAERGAYGSKYSDNYLQDSFPNFLFHFLFPFFFLMVQHLERDWAGVHPCRFPLRFLVVNFPFAVLNE